MADYNVLKAAIADYVKDRTGLSTIDGDGLQETLMAMVNSLGANYQFAGIAKLTPTQTDPGTPDQNVFYIASEPGTYTNFPISGGYLQVAENEVAIFKYNGQWSKETTGAATADAVNQLGQKLLKITKWQTDWSGATANDIVYRSDLKLLKQFRGGIWVTIPYYDGAVYTYNGQFYVWNGTDLVSNHVAYLIQQPDSDQKLTARMNINAADLESQSIAKPYAVTNQYAKVDGSIASSSSWKAYFFRVDDYMKNVTCRVASSDASFAAIAFYDSGTFNAAHCISTIASKVWTGDFNSQIPAGTKYFIVSNRSATLATPQIAIGGDGDDVRKVLFNDSINIVGTQLTFEQGGITGGKNYDATTRIRTDFIPVYNVAKIGWKEGYVTSVVQYRSKTDWLSVIDGGPIDREIKRTELSSECKYIRVTLRKGDGTNLVPSDGNDVLLYTYPFLETPTFDYVPDIEPDNLYNYQNARNNTLLSSSNYSIISPYSGYWITGLIPVDERVCEFIVLSHKNFHTAVCYDESMTPINYAWDTVAKKSLMKLLSGTRYVRFCYNETELSFDSCDRVFVGYANGGKTHMPNVNVKSSAELQIIDEQMPSMRTLSKFSATIVRGEYSSGQFLVDGVAVTPSTTEIYLDTTNDMTYRYDGAAFNELELWYGSAIFTQGFSIEVPAGNLSKLPMVITHNARYFGATAPGITYRIKRRFSSYPVVYSTIKYNIGDADNYVERRQRCYPFLLSDPTITIEVDIPSGTTLFVKDFAVNYSAEKAYFDGGFRLNGHASYLPDQSLQYFNLMALLGYPACVTIPKVTSDGVFVCFHDDDNINQARYNNGQVVCAKVGNDYVKYDEDGNVTGTGAMPVESLTYDFLKTLDFGITKGYEFAGTRIAKLEDYFRICAKTSMHPMLSVHPDMTTEQWEQIKGIVAKYGLTKKLNIKSGAISILEHIFGIFGTDIESYTLDVSDDVDATQAMTECAIYNTGVRLGIEYLHHVITDARIASALAAGLFVACAPGTDNGPNTAAEYERLMDLGVTEFTDDYNPSYGLNW